MLAIMNENLVVGILIVVVGLPVIAAYWHKTTVRTSENELKRAMVERGMTADEIERVIAAGRSKEAGE